MKKNYLFDVDGLLQVLQAIKEGKPVEFRLLEEPDWRDFDPENCDIDTENCKYRIKPREYGKNIGTTPISPEDLQEDRIYLLRSDIDAGTIRGFICVKIMSGGEERLSRCISLGIAMAFALRFM